MICFKTMNRAGMYIYKGKVATVLCALVGLCSKWLNAGYEFCGRGSIERPKRSLYFQNKDTYNVAFNFVLKMNVVGYKLIT